MKKIEKNITSHARKFTGLHKNTFKRKVILKTPFNKKSNLNKIESILAIVSKEYDLKSDLIHEKTRKRNIIEPRKICHYFASKYTTLSLAKIGELIGSKDHATVLNSRKKVNNYIETDKNFKFRIESINFNLLKS